MPETQSGSNPFRRKAPASSGAPPPPLAQVSSPGGFGPSPPPPPSVAADRPGAPATTALSSGDYFRSQLETLPHSAQPPPSTSFQKPKVVKRVRVQSPPPSSPESASGALGVYPVRGDSEDSSTSSDDDEAEGEDPFRGAPSPLGLSEEEGGIGGPPPLSSYRPPLNPFQKQKTLEDIGESPKPVNQAGNTSAGGKGSLDVQAFRQLLLTGLGGTSGTTASPPAAANQPAAAAGDGASITDASSVSRQSMFDATLPQESPRTSHDISDTGEDDQLGLVRESLAKTQPPPSTLRKKPPPPSSRHGKLIKVDLSQKPRDIGDVPPGILQASSPSWAAPNDSSPGSSPSKHRTSTDVNKPLPPAPARSSIDGDPESIFDREAAGKVPEPDVDLDTAVLPPPRPPTPPKASHAKSAAVSPQAPRKPAPPPRRNTHARVESKASITPRLNTPPTAVAAAAASAPSGEELEPARRASVDSARSHSSSLRVNIHAPAPPPPRRPTQGSRQSASFASPSALSFSSIASSSGATSPTAPDIEPASSHPRHGSIDDAVSMPAVASGVVTAPGGSNTGSPGSHHHAPVRPSPPQPPPARNPSVRSPHGGRPASVSSFEATSRRVSREKEGGGGGGGSGLGGAQAPPPPPRSRPKRSTTGGARDGADASRSSSSGDGARVLGGAVSEEPAAGAGSDILADLDALQREVDEMRGRYEKGGPGGGGAGS